MKKDDDRYDFQIVHHFIDLNELTLKKIPVGSFKVLNIVHQLTFYFTWYYYY